MESPLNKLRTELGKGDRLSQFQLAMLLRTNQPTVSRIERGLMSLPEVVKQALGDLGLDVFSLSSQQDEYVAKVSAGLHQTATEQISAFSENR